MKHNLETEIRQLWQHAVPSVNTDEQEVFFDELFDATATTAVGEDSAVASAQWTEHKMTFVGRPISVGVVNGLVVSADLNTTERGARASEVLEAIHRQQYDEGMMLSIIMPADKTQRAWLETQGYSNVAHRIAAEAHIPADYVSDPRLEVEEVEEWGRELWIYYAQHAGSHDFELKLNEADFFALISLNDLRGGSVLVARRHGKICGMALVQREGKPLKSGKASDKQFRMNIKYILAADVRVLYGIQQYAATLAPDCKQIVITGGCPAKGFKGAVPGAMMRVIDAEKFLTFVAASLPGLQLNVTMRDDAHLPVNNRTFRLREGHLFVTTATVDSTSTPGGVLAMLMAGQPVQVPGL